MPIQEGKYVTPAWQNGGPPALDAAELTDIGNSIVKNQTDIEQNATDIQTANNNIQSANSSIQQNAQDIESLNGQISSIQTNYLQKSGGTMTGTLNMGNNKIINLGTPSNSNDAVTLSYYNNYTLRKSLIQSYSFSLSNSSRVKQCSVTSSDIPKYPFLVAYINISSHSATGDGAFVSLGLSYSTSITPVTFNVMDNSSIMSGIIGIEYISAGPMNMMTYSGQQQCGNYNFINKTLDMYLVGRNSLGNSYAFTCNGTFYLYGINIQ